MSSELTWGKLCPALYLYNYYAVPHETLKTTIYPKLSRYIQMQASITGEHSIPLSGTSPSGIAVGTVSVERVTVI